MADENVNVTTEEEGGTVTKPLLLDETGQALAGEMARQNFLLSQLVAAASGATPVATLKEIHDIVRAGRAQDIFTPGDQIMLNYKNGNTDYVLPFDIVGFGTFETQDGEQKPGMVIQSHYAMQAVQYDASEAAFVFPDGLAAGTYHFGIGSNWNKCINGKVYEFTTTAAIPAGGCVVIGKDGDFYNSALPDTDPANWRVYTFGTLASVTPIETLTLVEGDGGTDLGTLSSATKYGTTGPNNLQRAAYGYARWSQSANRQYYNSMAAAGGWWTPQNPYDRAPQQAASLPGFMAGFDDAFLRIIRPVKIMTALNTTSDSEIGTEEATFDTFFLPSLEQEYIVPQAAGIEGDFWPYWKERLGLETPQAQYNAGTNTRHIRYAFDAQTNAQNVRFRSSNRGNANNSWFMNTNGYASTNNAAGSFRGCPACVII